MTAAARNLRIARAPGRASVQAAFEFRSRRVKTMTDRFVLPQRFDNATVPALRLALLDRRGARLCLAAQEVETTGTLAIQLLVAARRQWQADGQDFAVISPSQALLEACRLLGIEVDDIGVEAAG